MNGFQVMHARGAVRFPLGNSAGEPDNKRRGLCETFLLPLIYELQGKTPIGLHSLCRPIGILTSGIEKSHFSLSGWFGGKGCVCVKDWYTKVLDSTPCFRCRFWRCSGDLSGAISCQWCFKVNRTTMKALHWKFWDKKTLLGASTFSSPALRVSRLEARDEGLVYPWFQPIPLGIGFRKNGPTMFSCFSSV